MMINRQIKIVIEFGIILIILIRYDSYCDEIDSLVNSCLLNPYIIANCINNADSVNQVIFGIDPEPWEHYDLNKMLPFVESKRIEMEILSKLIKVLKRNKGEEFIIITRKERSKKIYNKFVDELIVQGVFLKTDNAIRFTFVKKNGKWHLFCVNNITSGLVY